MKSAPIVQLYARAQKLWDNDLSDLPDSEALEVCDLNLRRINNPDTEFVWEVILCKIKVRQKAKTKMGAKQ